MSKFFVLLCSMALPVERMAAEEIMAERAERKAKAAMMPASTPGQRLLREATLGLIEAREVSQSIKFLKKLILNESSGGFSIYDCDK
jgi:hypothetical protein